MRVHETILRSALEPLFHQSSHVHGVHVGIFNGRMWKFAALFGKSFGQRPPETLVQVMKVSWGMSKRILTHIFVEVKINKRPVESIVADKNGRAAMGVFRYPPVEGLHGGFGIFKPHGLLPRET